MCLRGLQWILKDNISHRGPLKVLRGVQMDLKGFSEASRCPFWTLWILRDFEEIYGLFWAVLGGIALGFSQILYRIIKNSLQ